MITDTQKHRLASYFADQPVDVAYLFGSQATGNVHAGSDVDIAVLFHKSLDRSARFDEKTRMIGEVGSILKRNDVEILDLADASALFGYQAIAPKQVIAVNDDGRMKTFEQNAIRQYFDIRPAIAMIARRKLALLAEKGFSV